jgi:hypothetical protein
MAQDSYITAAEGHKRKFRNFAVAILLFSLLLVVLFITLLRSQILSVESGFFASNPAREWRAPAASRMEPAAWAGRRTGQGAIPNRAAAKNRTGGSCSSCPAGPCGDNRLGRAVDVRHSFSPKSFPGGQLCAARQPERNRPPCFLASPSVCRRQSGLRAKAGTGAVHDTTFKEAGGEVATSPRAARPATIRSITWTKKKSKKAGGCRHYQGDGTTS